MAKVRIGFSTHFEIENELAGIGTDNPTNTKQVLGNIHATNAKAVGITTLTTPFEGFADTKLSLQGSAGAKQGTTSGEIIIEGDVTVSSGTTFTSGPENLTVTDSFTLPGISDDKPTVGTTRFNENLAALEFYTGSEWRVVSSYVDMSSGGRGLTAGGVNPSYQSAISAYQMSTHGSTVSFGDLTTLGQGLSGFSGETRGLWGGRKNPSTDPSDVIDYVTIASSGNSIDFGNQTSARRLNASFSSSTRGIMANGLNPSKLNIIDYIEIATIGNAIDFGDTMTAGNSCSGFSSPTRGVFGQGTPSPSATTGFESRLETVTISSKGNSTKFGDLTRSRSSTGSCSNRTRGITGGGVTFGWAQVKNIDYTEIATEGNAIDFGNLSRDNHAMGACASCIRGFFNGGYGPGPSYLSSIEYVELATAGNGIDFGDLVISSESNGSLSDSHGGLGGF